MGRMMMTSMLCMGLILFPGVVMAQQAAEPPVGVEDREGVEEQKLETELGISPDQHKKMEELRKEFQVKQKAIHEELQGKKIALKEELESESAINRSKVYGLVADIKSLQGQMLDNRVEQVFKVRELLTDDQYKKLKEMRKKRKAEDGMRGKMRDKMWNKKNN